MSPCQSAGPGGLGPTDPGLKLTGHRLSLYITRQLSGSLQGSQHRVHSWVEGREQLLQSGRPGFPFQ